MKMPRALLLFCLLSAGPAAAQGVNDPLWMAREAELRTQQELMRQRSIALENEVTSLQSRLQAEQSLRTLDAQRQRPPVLAPSQGRLAGSPAGMAQIPEDRLSASNDRVRAASRP